MAHTIALACARPCFQHWDAVRPIGLQNGALGPCTRYSFSRTDTALACGYMRGAQQKGTQDQLVKRHVRNPAASGRHAERLRNGGCPRRSFCAADACRRLREGAFRPQGMGSEALDMCGAVRWTDGRADGHGSRCRCTGRPCTCLRICGGMGGAATPFFFFFFAWRHGWSCGTVLFFFDWRHGWSCGTVCVQSHSMSDSSSASSSPLPVFGISTGVSSCLEITCRVRSPNAPPSGARRTQRARKDRTQLSY
jgi:hypothetical protein